MTKKELDESTIPSLYKACLSKSPIKLLRAELSLTLEELAEGTSLSINYIRQLEGGMTTTVVDSFWYGVVKLGIQGWTLESLRQSFGDFKRTIRISTLKTLDLKKTVQEYDITVESPIDTLFKPLNLTEVMICKCLAMPPYILYNIRNNSYKAVPRELLEVFSDINIDPENIYIQKVDVFKAAYVSYKLLVDLQEFNKAHAIPN